MKEKITRELWIDYIKVFACVLVVIGHLLQGLNKANIQWNKNLYEYLNTFIYIFHMPLFMCLSGYLYNKSSKIKSINEYLDLIKKKFINLGVPFFIFYVFYVILNMIFSSNVNSQKGISDILNMLSNPIPPYWFLYALFFIFLFVPLFEKIFKNNRAIIMLIFSVLHIINFYIKTNIYAIDIVMEYAIYFYLGVILNNIINLSFELKNIIIMLVVFVFLANLYCYYKLNNVLNINILNIAEFFLAIFGVLTIILFLKYLFQHKHKIKILDFVSRYTFPIYLMHTIFSAGIRILTLKLNIVNFYFHFILGFFAGIIGPILITKLLEKSGFGLFVLYPLKTIKKYTGSN